MKKFLSLALALIMVMSLFTVGAGAAFTDAEEIKQEEAVALLSGLGVINGYTDGSFKPGNPITRGATAKILTKIIAGTTKTNALEKLGVDEKPFSDVEVDNGYAAFIQYCKANGVVGGYADGTFRPYANVKGYQFIKMVLVALGVKDIDWTAKGWEIEAAAQAEKMGLLKGVETVEFIEELSRENACQIAMNALTYTPTGAVKYAVYNTNGQLVTTYDNKSDAQLILALREGYTLKEVADLTDSLGYKNWNLTESTKTDAAGLEYKTWTNGELASSKKYVEYAAIAPELKLTYTKAVKANDIAKALGYAKEDYAKVTLNVTLNGTYDVANDVTLTGQGVETKVYAGAEKDTYTVIIVKKAVETVEKVNKASEDGKTKANIELSGGKTFETTEFKKGETVLVTYGVVKGETKVVAVEKPATVTGKVTAVAADGSYIRVDGDKYMIAAINEDDTTSKYYKYDTKTAYTYYLDTYGNIVKADDVKTETVTEDAKYIYVYASAVAVKNDSTNLFETTKGSATVQVKTVDLATGALSVKNLAVASKDGKFYLANKDGKANTAALLTDKMDLGLFGTYAFVEVDGKIVLTGEASFETVTLKKDTAVVATGKVATSATTFTTVEMVYELKDDVKTLTGATVKTVTGIAAFPSTAKTVDAIVAAKDGVVKSVLYITEAKPAEEKVNYAIYKGAGEIGATASYDFYVDGEIVTYTLAKGAAELTLTKGDVVTLTLKDGKLEAAAKATAKASGEIALIDSTFVQLKDGTVVYLKDTVVVDEDETYAAGELAKKDVVTVYGTEKDGKLTAAFIVIAK